MSRPANILRNGEEASDEELLSSPPGSPSPCSPPVERDGEESDVLLDLDEDQTLQELFAARCPDGSAAAQEPADNGEGRATPEGSPTKHAGGEKEGGEEEGGEEEGGGGTGDESEKEDADEERSDNEDGEEEEQPEEEHGGGNGGRASAAVPDKPASPAARPAVAVGSRLRVKRTDFGTTSATVATMSADELMLVWDDFFWQCVPMTEFEVLYGTADCEHLPDEMDCELHQRVGLPLVYHGLRSTNAPSMFLCGEVALPEATATRGWRWFQVAHPPPAEGEFQCKYNRRPTVVADTLRAGHCCVTLPGPVTPLGGFPRGGSRSRTRQLPAEGSVFGLLGFVQGTITTGKQQNRDFVVLHRQSEIFVAMLSDIRGNVNIRLSPENDPQLGDAQINAAISILATRQPATVNSAIASAKVIPATVEPINVEEEEEGERGEEDE